MTIFTRNVTPNLCKGWIHIIEHITYTYEFRIPAQKIDEERSQTSSWVVKSLITIYRNFVGISSIIIFLYLFSFSYFINNSTIFRLITPMFSTPPRTFLPIPAALTLRYLKFLATYSHVGWPCHRVAQRANDACNSGLPSWIRCPESVIKIYLIRISTSNLGKRVFYVCLQFYQKNNVMTQAI